MIEHKFNSCQKTKAVWGYINTLFKSMGSTETEQSLEHKLGQQGDPSKLDLTIQAEILANLNLMAGKPYDPKAIVLKSLNTIVFNDGEKLHVETQENITSFIDALD